MSRHSRQLNRRHRKSATRLEQHTQKQASAARAAGKRAAELPASSIKQAEASAAVMRGFSIPQSGRFCVQMQSDRGASFSPVDTKSAGIFGKFAANTASELKQCAQDVARANPGARVRVIRPEAGSRAVYRFRWDPKSNVLGTYST